MLTAASMGALVCTHTASGLWQCAVRCMDHWADGCQARLKVLWMLCWCEKAGLASVC